MAIESPGLLVVPGGTTTGARIRLARMAAGLSRKELARELGVSLRTLQRMEEDARELRMSELNALVVALGQDAAFFGASSGGSGEPVLAGAGAAGNSEPPG